MIGYRLLTALSGAALLGLAAVPALAQMYERITIHNSTGYTVAQIFLSPSDQNDWEEDILDLDVLDDGREVEIDFRRAVNTCEWDLKVIYADGDAAVWNNLDLCEDWYFELFYNARTGDTRLVASH